MPQRYTENDLLRYLYHETTTAENAGIARQMNLEPAFAESFDHLHQAISVLPECEMMPNPTSVRLIMEYAMKHEARLEH